MKTVWYCCLVFAVTIVNSQDTAWIDNLCTRLKEKFKSLDANMNTVDSATKPAFFAVISNATTLTNDQILKFDSVKTNIGGGYRPTIGIFVAPKKGTYHFTSVVYSNAAGQDITIQMVKNKEVLALGYSSGASHAESNTMNVVTSLNRGDYVYVQHRGYVVDVARGRSHSTFSGFQI